MTVKISVSLPDDVAAHLAEQENSSAYIAEAVRQRASRDRTRAALAAVGCPPVPADQPASAERVRRIAEAVTPQLRDTAMVNVARHSGRTLDEVRRHVDRVGG